ncbi:hypothetical protein ATANTOWER_012121 [Ataeniobius toweri]|uniref:Uncharacterized protein n=1 Tax=Ataeniobius toweri TaxID=208326 RepID=A0ABU7C7A3_9TELE|nr:hypothetical protein [Ataeniobius toweri]
MIYCMWMPPIVVLCLRSEQMPPMERSLAFDLHIMLCLPASTHLYISSDKIRAFSLKHLDCDILLPLGATAKHHICIARFWHTEASKAIGAQSPRETHLLQEDVLCILESLQPLKKSVIHLVM